jgi:hypothetical protein
MAKKILCVTNIILFIMRQHVSTRIQDKRIERHLGLLANVEYVEDSLVHAMQNQNSLSL